MVKTIKRISNASIRKQINKLEKMKKDNEERKKLLMKLRSLKQGNVPESRLKKVGSAVVKKLRGLNVQF